MAEKRRGKLHKKARGGSINTQQNFEECRALGIEARASVEFVKDSTRQKCQHDLNIQVGGGAALVARCGPHVTRRRSASCTGPTSLTSPLHSPSVCLSVRSAPQEVRDLLLSLLKDDCPSKYFALRNKAFIRHVALVHVQDCDDGSVLRGGLRCLALPCVAGSGQWVMELRATETALVLTSLLLCVACRRRRGVQQRGHRGPTHCQQQ